METASAGVGSDESMSAMFLHARFELPHACGSVEDGSDKCRDHSIESSLETNDQYFDTTNCSSAVIGLPPGAEPIKVSCIAHGMEK